VFIAVLLIDISGLERLSSFFLYEDGVSVFILASILQHYVYVLNSHL